MKSDALLIEVYEMIRQSDIFHDKTELEWVSELLYLYEKGWLYGAFKSKKLVAVAGAFRIREWREEYRRQLPRKEEGNVLFVPFLVCLCENMSIPLRLLNRYLRENPSVKELVYFKKGWGTKIRHLKVTKRSHHNRPIARLSQGGYYESLQGMASARRLSIAPPLIPN